jgi:hypothetical protein
MDYLSRSVPKLHREVHLKRAFISNSEPSQYGATRVTPRNTWTSAFQSDQRSKDARARIHRLHDCARREVS